MRYVNKSGIFLLLTVTSLSLPCTYLIFRQNEASIATSAQQFLQESPTQEGAVESVQIFYRIFCSKARHGFCSAKVINEKGQLLSSVPTLSFENTPLYALSLKRALNQFSPPLFVILTFTPSLAYLLLWTTMALGIAGLAGIIAWSFGLRSAKQSLERNLKLELELRKVEAGLGNLATQVAHDIRSPLAALDNVIGNIKVLPEDDRILVRAAVNRIKDIANNLIEKNRELKSGQKGAGSTGTNAATPAATTEAHIVQLLSSLVDPLVTEKRMQFRSKIGIEIDGRVDASSYGLFAKIQPTEFKRVLSNLVNNAVEVLGDRGTVTITLATKNNQIEIRVADNGKGIPPEILAKLGRRGETHGKQGGSGLGLYHACTSVESWGGKLTIESEVGNGTAVVITLPQAKAPEWFVSELILTPQASVVVLDDDSSIHGIWQGRFDSLRVQEKGIEVLHFSTPDELTKWVTGSPAAKTALYLADFELLGHKQTGLDLIEALKLGPQSILVTSRFEEKHIVEGCHRLGVRLIPKGMSGFVPISLGVALEAVDAILIDDDSLVHMTWKSAANQLSKSLRAFSHPDQFFSVAGGFTKNSPVYVDANLGDGITGEDVAKRVHELGFVTVYLATGYEPEQFQGHSFLAGVLGKDPPFGS